MQLKEPRIAHFWLATENLDQSINCMYMLTHANHHQVATLTHDLNTPVNFS